MSDDDFGTFFRLATGFPEPYLWQGDIARDGLPEVLPVPTGLGKTEGVTLAWAWRRQSDPSEPRHLVYCLPMRALVRQTVDKLRACFERLAAAGRTSRVPVYELMGGSIEHGWVSEPDLPWVLVGTQDQLLSRALNRGYAMRSRFEWPVHFGLLNCDCRWIVDEVQLMGPGVWTTAQLDWMRRKRFPPIKPCRTTWMSATVGTSFLETTDRRRDGMAEVSPIDLRLEEDEAVRARRLARRAVEWLEPQTGKRAPALHDQVASAILEEHRAGTLSLAICNTVADAQSLFRSIRAKTQVPTVLLTSRFRRRDRSKHERALLEFEAKRKAGAIAPEDPGLICVSTQVVEAGVDISAHRLWSELAPWPSSIQRLGRLNRDGRDDSARARFWRTPAPKKAERVGPYERKDLERALELLGAVVEPSSRLPFIDALAELRNRHAKTIDDALRPPLHPHPRALDVHGLFSTEPDLFGGFTDVSPFVRGADPDADVLVLWRTWVGRTPPRNDELRGPPIDPEDEGCAVSVHHARGLLASSKATAWMWNDERGEWANCKGDDLRPGMTVMLHRDVGGYSAPVGWTGDTGDRLDDVLPAGPGRALADDERTEAGYWARLSVHLADARSEAERLCDALGITGPVRLAVVEAAASHDIGKAHPQWQKALPSLGAFGGALLAKCPRVLAVEAGDDDPEIQQYVVERAGDHVPLPSTAAKRGKGVRLKWAVAEPLPRQALEEIRAHRRVRWAGYVGFRPGMRHEAASALAMWRAWRDGASHPALAVYLAAAHHGKVRTVLRSTSGSDDVFGVPREPAVIELDARTCELDFSVAADGADGIWRDGTFEITDYGWTGLVADLLGPWRGDDAADSGVVPEREPRRLGPFTLAYLEALVRVADWRASDAPSESLRPGEVADE